MLLTHWAPGRVRLGVERLPRGRESLVGQGVRRGLMEVGEASRWTLKDSRAWDYKQAAAGWGEERRPHLPKAEPTHMA